ncbi:MAG: DeoR/GlpR family DNA-binding transcription regulator [Spirochaetaceae bacterium]|jgi:DeoR family fructose operon transcriptional repressor|nr:DeoR/GlpR family DNA-binding transcription regulator [Spirochaetaceae bacterium]
MFQIERQEKILRYINDAKKANTGQLAREFNVSKVTIRRDIDVLAQKGLLFKAHGGAVSSSSTFLHEIPYSDKAVVNSAAKKAIGLTAAKMIEDGDIIILDAGSTTLEIAKNIKKDNITVLTNDLKIAMELTNKPNIHVMVSGGNLTSSVYTLTGNISVDFFKKIHVNKTFLGCDAVDIEFGISNRTYEEIDIKLAMIKAADEVIMVTDNSKLGKKVFAYLCDVSAINKLVINKIDDGDSKAFTEKGVELIITAV